MTIRLRADEALATLAADKGGALALNYHVEIVARVALRDDGVAFARHLLTHRLGDLAEDRLIPLRKQVVITQHRHDRGDALG